MGTLAQPDSVSLSLLRASFLTAVGHSGHASTGYDSLVSGDQPLYGKALFGGLVAAGVDFPLSSLRMTATFWMPT
jgi:hypothetical protein